MRKSFGGKPSFSNMIASPIIIGNVAEMKPIPKDWRLATLKKGDRRMKATNAVDEYFSQALYRWIPRLYKASLCQCIFFPIF